jgi:uncharacterized membrane protein
MAEKKETAPTPAAAEKPKAAAKGGDDNNLIAALCYIPFFAIGLLVSLYVLLTEKKGVRYLKFHAVQALLLMVGGGIVLTIVYIMLGIVGMLLAMVSGGIGAICVYGLMGVIFIAWIVVLLYCAWKAFNGAEYEIPTVGKYARKYV